MSNKSINKKSSKNNIINNNSNITYLDKVINSDIKSITNNKIKPKKKIINNNSSSNILSSKLTIKQQRFINNYIISSNITEAALKAGYAKRSASSTGTDLLKNPKIIKALEEKLKKIEDKKIATASEVLQFLTSALRGEIDEDHVAVVGRGEGMSEAQLIKKKINPKDRIKSAELLAKRFGLLIEKVEVKDERSNNLLKDLAVQVGSNASALDMQIDTLEDD